MLVQSTSTSVSVPAGTDKILSVGLDMGVGLWEVGILDWSTGKFHSHSLRGSDKESKCHAILREYVGRGYKVHLTYEAGRFGFTPAREMTALGVTVRVLPVNKLEVIQSGKKRKTDRLDARFLAHLDPFDPTLPSVYVPTIDEECDRGYVREGRRLKEDIGRNNQRILSILERWLIATNKRRHQTSSDWEKAIESWKLKGWVGKELPESECSQIINLVESLRLLEKQQSDWDEQMDQHESEQRQERAAKGEQLCIDIVTEHRGIGDISARTLSWLIGEFRRFENGRKFGSYFGLTPTPWISCKTRREQGISKEGNRELRRISIQLAWLWVYWQPESALTKKWGPKLKQKGRVRRIAIVGLARQLMVALYHRVVSGREIEGAIKNKIISDSAAPTAAEALAQ